MLHRKELIRVFIAEQIAIPSRLSRVLHFHLGLDVAAARRPRSRRNHFSLFYNNPMNRIPIADCVALFKIHVVGRLI